MIDNGPTFLSLTDAAAGKLREITADEPNPNVGLRVYVYSGGCSGFRYGMMIEDAPTAEDQVLESPGIKVYVDTKSIDLLRGLADRLRRHPDGRRLHGEQPERGRRLRLRLVLPDGRVGRQPGCLPPLIECRESPGRSCSLSTPPASPAASSRPHLRAPHPRLPALRRSWRRLRAPMP